jgi:hypothetical protein
MVKCFTKEALRKANNVAIKTNRNRTIRNKDFMKQPENFLFPIRFAMPHNDEEMRVEVILDEKKSGWIDIPFETFDALPIHS